jgi:hypothetical protein
MKRNNSTVREARRVGKSTGRSRYAMKVRAGQQMYGPGCCGHRITETQVREHRAELRRSGHFSRPAVPSPHGHVPPRGAEPSWDEYMGAGHLDHAGRE